ncbi:hypothetical protein GCM10023063_03180 [Arthrobacter methylotrophus]|uniref:hypothetical protein n=1 Tax=Arthrobacter methylotrophus TaxID=121291 RepID=UPI0031E8B875
MVYMMQFDNFSQSLRSSDIVKDLSISVEQGRIAGLLEIPPALSFGFSPSAQAGTS